MYEKMRAEKERRVVLFSLEIGKVLCGIVSQITLGGILKCSEKPFLVHLHSKPKLPLNQKPSTGLVSLGFTNALCCNI